jgi:hypothetical protein
MRARNMWIIAGIAAIAALVAWWLLRGDDRRPNPETRGDAKTAPGSGTSTTRDPTRNIPKPRVGGSGTPVSEDTLRPTVERALEPTGAKVASIDCDEARCEIAVEAPDDDDLNAAISALEAALPEVATNMIVSAPTAVDGGRRMVITAELQ